MSYFFKQIMAVVGASSLVGSAPIYSAIALWWTFSCPFLTIPPTSFPVNIYFSFLIKKAKLAKNQSLQKKK